MEMPAQRYPEVARRVTLLLITLLTFVLPANADEQRWPHETTAGSFHVHASFPLAPYRNILAELPKLETELQSQLGVQPGTEIVHLYLFSNKATYDRYLKHFFPKVSRRRAIYVKARGPGMVFAYQNRDLAEDLRHECTHALLHSALPMVPLWLDEGIAEYFEVPASERAYDNEYLGKVQWGVKFGVIPRLSKLETTYELKNMGTSEYRGSWAWVHFMLHGPPAARNELQAYLKDIAAHSPPGKLSHRLGRKLPDPQGQFSNHFRGWKR